MQIYICIIKKVSIITEMKVTYARQRVFAYLRSHPGSSAVQIGRALGMSAANVRHHLSILCSDGRVEKVGKVNKTGRGKPVNNYSLSILLGNNLTSLANAVMSEWLKARSTNELRKAMRSLARTIQLELKTHELRGPLPGRLIGLVERLNSRSYQARWEAGSAGPRVLFGRCPYQAIIEKHPELCLMDQAVLEQTLDVYALQTTRIGKNGSTHCTFLIKQQ